MGRMVGTMGKEMGGESEMDQISIDVQKNQVLLFNQLCLGLVLSFVCQETIQVQHGLIGAQTKLAVGTLINALDHSSHLGNCLIKVLQEVVVPENLLVV